MYKSPYKLPLLPRINYWLGYGYLSLRGKLASGMPEEHNFEPSIGTYLFRKGEAQLLKYCEQNVPEHTEDIAVREIRAEDLTLDIMREMRKQQLPLLIRGGAKHWRAVKELDFDYFAKNYGDIYVPAHAEPNKVFEDNGKPVPLKNFYQMSKIKIRDLIDSVKGDGQYSAKAIEDIMHEGGGSLIKEFCDLDHIHQLSDLKHYMKKWYFKRVPVGYAISKQLFIQSARSHTLWHTEPGYNYFVAVKGQKRWHMAPPLFSPGLYPVIKKNAAYHVSKVDGREQNDVIARRGFPLYRYVPRYTALVNPADILVLPHFWWHMVSNVGGPSISLTFRTITEPNVHSPMFNFLKFMDPASKEIRKKVIKFGRLFDDDIASSLYAFADPKNDLRNR